MIRPDEAIPIRRRKVDLVGRLRRALGALEQQARDADIGFALTCTPEPFPEVNVDDTKIVWAITALVGNSLRFVRRGTRHRPGGSIAVNLGLDGGELRLEVVDDGPGMPDVPAAVLRGAAPPDTTAPALALVHDVVRAQGGRVDVSATQGTIDHGTAVTLRIPID